MDRLASRAALPRGAGLAETFLTPELLRRLAQAGMAVGAHTRSHPHLDRIDPAAMAEEIEGGKGDLEAAIGGPVRHFAYPNPGEGAGTRRPGCRPARRRLPRRGHLPARAAPVRGRSAAPAAPRRLRRRAGAGAVRGPFALTRQGQGCAFGRGAPPLLVPRPLSTLPATPVTSRNCHRPGGDRRRVLDGGIAHACRISLRQRVASGELRVVPPERRTRLGSPGTRSSS